MKISKKNFILIIFPILFLISCGYTPMYKDLKNLDFSIIVGETSGDRSINNKIKSNLNSYQLDEANKKYNISFEPDYNKKIIAKNTTGAATEYKIILNIKFLITSLDLNKELNFTESFNMQSMSDKLEEQDYENNIKDSLSNIITRKLVLQLSQAK